MSRGFGVAQRFVLDFLAAQADREPWERWSAAQVTAHERACGGTLTRHPYEDDGDLHVLQWVHYECDRCGIDTPVAASDLESVRRAMRTLAKAGHVELAWVQSPSIGGGPTPDWPRQLHARLPLTDDELERERLEGKRPGLFDLLPWGAREAIFGRLAAGERTDA